MEPDPRTPPLRKATPEDVGEIHSLVCDLAAYEKLRHAVTSTPADLHHAFFGHSPRAEAFVSEAPRTNTPPISGSLAGFSIILPTFSTFTGQAGLWLEDVYVRPELRGRGLGRAFLEHFLTLAKERGCARAEWSVLDWNTPAIEFYQHLGAHVMPDWRIARMEL